MVTAAAVIVDHFLWVPTPGARGAEPRSKQQAGRHERAGPGLHRHEAPDAKPR
jgi:hypothetical protein